MKFVVVHIRECYTLPLVHARLEQDRVAIAGAKNDELSITYTKRVITSVMAMRQVCIAVG